MYTESVLTESRSARSAVAHRVEVLDRVKALALSPDGVRASTRDVAAFFEVEVKVVEKLVERHRKELQESGMAVVVGGDLRKYQTDNVSVCSEGEVGYPQGGYPQRRKSLMVFTRRAVLNVGMLLRDSEVARRVRRYLLEAESARRDGAAEAESGWVTCEARLDRVEAAVHEIGVALRELGPVLARMSGRLAGLDRRLEGVEQRLDLLDHRVAAVELRTAHTEQLICGLSRRLADGH
ncbi:hypothetical protein [Streptomyces xiaopingdaonensis]|uniref:hypothetical protein n=1 Tax=Streptomyces xiaopingdaonensis TaxID=1565415 RepID=UPI0003021D7E|nr:hypothetical protein [Streptomyces xiaopingdaonensis]